MGDSPVQTSATSPLGVGWLEGTRGQRVGLTMAPGKHAWSKQGFRWQRDLGADLQRLTQEHGAQVLVNLMQDDEMARIGVPGLVEATLAHGMAVYRLPIPDGGVLPHKEPVQALAALLDMALRERTVVIHCQGGLGRSGTVGACLLVHQGCTAAEALAAVQRARGRRAPETEEQKAFVREFATWLTGRPALDRDAALALLRRHGGDFREPRARSVPTWEDRVAGAILAAAVGDAVGHPTEFMTLEAIHQRFGPQGVQGYELYWERDGKRFAPYTDDTQMSEAVIRGLLDGDMAEGNLDTCMRAIAVRFMAWARNPQGGHRAPGNACLAGCRALQSGVPWQEAGGATAGGCGSVMRAHPFGVVFLDVARAEQWAVEHSKLTHRDPIALAACAAMAVGVAAGVRGQTLENQTGLMVEAAGRYSSATADMMTQALRAARDGVGPEVTLKQLRGWAAHEAIAAALYILQRHPDDLRAAILEGANTAGDSDSMASMAGALVGARVGRQGIPADWLRDLERTEELQELAAQLCRAAR